MAFVAFLFVGAVGFVLDAGLVLLLTSAGLSPVLARVPALSAAIVTTWLLNRTIAFRVDVPRSRNELARYSAVALSSAVLNFLLYTALVTLGTWPVAAVAIATVCLLFYNFLGYRHYAFTSRTAANPEGRSGGDEHEK